MTREVAARGRAGARQAMWAPAQPGTARVAMAELQQLRVQEAVDSMVKSLERENIRKMQVAGRKPTWGLGGASTVRGFLPLPAAASGSFRTTACQPADPGRGVPGVVAAPLEALLTLRTGASAERMKSVSPRHAQGRLPPAPKARPGRGCPLARVEKPPGVRCSASPTFQSCAAASQVSSQSPPKEHRQGERPETRRCSASSVAWSCSAHAAMSHMLFCFDPLNVMRLLIPLP